VSKLRVLSFAISIDGYGAGPNQDLQNPLGVGGPELMEWFFHTRLWRRMHGHEDGEAGVDNGIVEQAFAGIGAWILGRNMFGPVRGPWPDESWRGWWGEEPPYHTPVFVLTHQRARRCTWRGHRVSFRHGGIRGRLAAAQAAAGAKDVCAWVAGWPPSVNICAPALLTSCISPAPGPACRGEHLLHDIDMRAWAMSARSASRASEPPHLFLRRR
jgi:dihydrofolate reductase